MSIKQWSVALGSGQWPVAGGQMMADSSFDRGYGFILRRASDRKELTTGH
jgi:hypothetical protein